MIVELKYAGIPRLGIIAVHYWFVASDNGFRDRWEVWQSPNAGGASTGHLHRNLMHPDSSVGGGPTQLEKVWTDADARNISEALFESWKVYPFRECYRAVPGPNSNTYVAWVLNRAKISHRLSWKAIGKNFKKPT